MKKNPAKKIFMTICLSAVFGLTACEQNEGPAEKAGKKIDQAAEKTSQKYEEAKEVMNEEASKAADYINEKLAKPEQTVEDEKNQ
ncbi:MAG: hypothetical protein IBX55_06980 [Methyloprofundus sp.]|nr:hypothetical protein [Methyloprofundus sp.]MBW6452204.1 hypothetical protein [Methyloprofundus sp.]